MTDNTDAPRHPAPHPDQAPGSDDVIRIEDLAPPEDIRGGRKILLGEILTPPSNPRIIPES